MVSLRMVAVYLLPRFPDLLDYEKVVFGLDNPFDALLFMSRDDDEVVALLHDGCVAGGRNLDRLDTATTTALTVKRVGIQRRGAALRRPRSLRSPCGRPPRCALLVQRSPSSRSPVPVAGATACSVGSAPSAGASALPLGPLYAA